MANLVSILQKRASQYNHDTAYLFLGDGEHETDRISYGEVDIKARSIAAYLQKKTKLGQRVLLCYPSGIDFIAAFMGCLYAGVIAVPVFCAYLEQIETMMPYIKKIIEHAKISGILADTIFLKQLESDCQKSSLSSIVFLSDIREAEQASLPFTPLEFSPESVAYLQYTSGSLSDPKAAIVLHRNLMHSLKFSGISWGYNKKNSFLTWSPHAHVFGLVCGLLLPLFHGSFAIILPPNFVLQQPFLWLKAISKYKVTHSGCPNFGYDLCVQNIPESMLTDLNLSSWKVAINGGEPINQKTLIEFSEKFKPYGFRLNSFCPAYGMSELTGAIAVSTYGKKPQVFHLDLTDLENNRATYLKDLKLPHATYVSCGNLLDGLKATIVHPEKLIPLSSHQIGEIWLTGQSLISGYWQGEDMPDHSFLTELPGSGQKYFRTGDLGFLIKKEICLTGRLKDIIVRYGKKYNPNDLEKTVFESLLAVQGKNIFFSLDIEGKEEIIFLQEIPNMLTVTEQADIIASIRQAIFEKYGLDIHSIYFVEAGSLPRTQSGKIQRRLCKQFFSNNKLKLYNAHLNKELQSENRVQPINTSDSLVSREFSYDCKKILATVLKVEIEKIKSDAPFSSYGLDSIKIIQLMNEFNSTYGLTLTPVRLYEYATLQVFIDQMIKEFNEQISSYYLNLNHSSQESRFKLNRNDKIDSYTSLATPKTIRKSSDEIAIIGMNGIFPGANDLTSFWENILCKKNVISEIPGNRWDERQFDLNNLNNSHFIKLGGFVDDIDKFDAKFFNISPHEAELTDPQQRILLQTVWKTIEDSGYSISELSKKIVGVFVGVFGNDYAELLHFHKIEDAYLTTGTTHSILANRISYLLDFKGPSEAIDTACSSSLVAIHHAVNALQNNDCDLAIAGGVNALLSPNAFISAGNAGMLSHDGRCKVFDKDANGYVRSEGAGAILLKPLHLAQRDGDHIYAIIKGSAVNHGGHVSSLTAPNPNAQADVIVAACERANVSVDTISYIEAHGTGTSLGDPIEITGLKKAFKILETKENKKLSTHFCGIGSLKTHVGHLESAAGIASVIKVLLSLKNKILPGNLNFKTLNPYIDIKTSPFYILEDTQPWVPNKNTAGDSIPLRSGISSFGFGGTNAHLILEEAPKIYVPELQEDRKLPFLFALSAKTEVALQTRLQELFDWINEQQTTSSLAATSYMLNKGREHFAMRCAIIADDLHDLNETLLSAIHLKSSDNYVINTTNSNRKYTSFQMLCDSLVKEIHDTTISSEEYRKKLLALGHFYVEGYEISWDDVHHGEKRRVSLPTYPFAKERYWVPESHQKKLNTVKDKNEIATYEEINELLIDSICDNLKILKNEVSLHFSLTELGFDSISMKQLSIELENIFNLEISPSIFFTYPTVQALSQYLFKTISSDQKENITYSIKPKSNEQIIDDSVAIIGVQGYLPQSGDIKEFWDHLLNGHDLITQVPSERWNWQDYYGDSKTNSNKTNSKWGGFLNDVDKFDANFFNISAREANLMDPQHRLFMEIIWKTIEDAGYNPFQLSDLDVGLFVGIEFNEYQTLIATQKQIFHGHVATGNSHALLANRISYFLNLKGPSEVVNTACSSALVAVHRAVNAIRQNECIMALAGGVSLILSPENYVITSQLGALSPDGRCKTFDATANGYVKGEGVAAIMLKKLSDARKDGDFIYGIIKSSVVSHGGKAQSLTAPNVTSQKNLLIKAYQKANIDVSTVTYIETHGTGTELGDPAEIEGLKQAFRTLLPTNSETQQSFCGLGSVKTNIGHLEPASGMAGIIKVLFSMRYGKIPGNLHFNELNSFINLEDSPFYIIQQTQEWKRLKRHNEEIPRRAGVSSFGFGGTYAHVVIEEDLDENVVKHLATNPCYVITLSAKQEESLKQKVIDLYAWLKTERVVDINSLSYTLNNGRGHFNYRRAFVVRNLEELMFLLKQLIEGKQPDGTFYKVLHQGSHNENIKQFTADELKHFSSSEYRDYLYYLAQSYVNGAFIDWENIFSNKRRLASLPTYPFIKKRFWFDAELPGKIDINQNNLVIQKNVTNNLEMNTLDYLRKIFADKLKLTPNQISNDNTYEIYGIDSLLSLEITTRLEVDFGALPKTLLYERNKLRDLADYFIKMHSDTLHKITSQLSDVSNESYPVNDLMASDKIVRQIPPSTSLCEPEIAVIGMSINFPMANDLHEFWNNLSKGRDCIIEIPNDRWDYRDYPIQVGEEKKFFKYGGFIPDIDKFDPLFFNISPREAMLMDPQERLFMQTAWCVLEDAGITRDNLRRTLDNKVGVFAGATYNFYPLLIAEEWSRGNRLPLDIQMFSIANRVSYFLNLKGPSYVVDTACSSSLAAIHLACESIRSGECLAAIAGGVNLSLHPSKYHFLGGYGFLSATGRCESFGKGGEGYVPSEGVGAVLLKPLALARRDGDKIYAIIKGSSMNHGAKTSGYTVPNPNAQADLIIQALEKAKINPRTISYIEAHGTGTSLGDPIEIRGLQDAFQTYTNEKQFCAIGSVKSNIGHLESAAGISQLTKVILQLQHQKLVPSLHSEQVNPYINFQDSPFYVQQDLVDWDAQAPRRAGISSFGAGGTNVHVIVEEYQSQPIETDSFYDQKIPFIFLLSAQNQERLQEFIEKMKQFITKESEEISPEVRDAWMYDLCYTLQIGRENMASRLACLANTVDELISKLTTVSENFHATVSQLWLGSVSQNSVFDHSIKEAVDQKNYHALPKLWVEGARIDWDTFYPKNKPRRVSLPTYPFAKRRCWVGSTKENKVEPSLIKITKHSDLEPEWLIFNDKLLGFHLQQLLPGCVQCYKDEEFHQFDASTYYLNPASKECYETLVASLANNKVSQLKGVIFLWETLESLSHIVWLAKAFENNKISNLPILWVTREKEINVENCLKTLSTEPEGFPHFPLTIIKLPKIMQLAKDAELIVNEISSIQPGVNFISCQDGSRQLTPLIKNETRFPSVQKVNVNYDEVIALLLQVVSSHLALEKDEIDLHEPFLHYGMDSILGINFIAELDKHYPNLLAPMDLYRYPNLQQLGNFIAGCYQSAPKDEQDVSNTLGVFPDEEAFLTEINHLNQEEIARLLQDELMELDKLME